LARIHRLPLRRALGILGPLLFAGALAFEGFASMRTF